MDVNPYKSPQVASRRNDAQAKPLLFILRVAVLLFISLGSIVLIGLIDWLLMRFLH
jgi:hypothetical protein